MFLNFKEERRILKNESLVLSRNLKKPGVFLPKSKVSISKSLQAKGQKIPKANYVVLNQSHYIEVA